MLWGVTVIALLLFTVAGRAGPLEDSLRSVREQADADHTHALAAIRAGTSPPTDLTYPLKAAQQVDLTLRWWAMRDDATCARFEEMREVLRRSEYAVGPADDLPPRRSSYSSNRYEPLMAARFEALTGAPPTWRTAPTEAFAWSDRLDEFVTHWGHGMVGAVEYCDADVLLDLRDELMQAGLADRPGQFVTSPSPDDLTIGDRLEVKWASEQVARAGDIQGAEAGMVVVLARRHNAAPVVAEAKKIQRQVAELQKTWNVCSGRPCREGGQVLLAVRRRDLTRVHVDRPECDRLIEDADRADLDRLPRGSARLGDLVYALYGMGCVEGVPARFADTAAVERFVAELPEECGQPPAPEDAGLRDLLARTRKAIFAGCVEAPWSPAPSPGEPTGD